MLLKKFLKLRVVINVSSKLPRIKITFLINLLDEIIYYAKNKFLMTIFITVDAMSSQNIFPKGFLF